MANRSDLQPELDLIDTINAVTPVFDAYKQGGHDDLQAVAIGGRAIQRKAHRAMVARVNRTAA